MSENEKLQTELQAQSKKPRGRKKVETELTVIPDTEDVKPVVKITKKPIKAWLVDEYKATKKCPDCGAEMHGWAFRQKFVYCPFCGTELM